MSPEDGAPARHAKRRQRAEQDVKNSLATLLELEGRFAGEAWSTPAPQGWSPAEVCMHLLLTAEEALEGLRTKAASGSEPARSMSLARQLDKRMTLLTWKLPRRVLARRAAEPQGLILAGTLLAARATTWAADAIQFLRESPHALLVNLRREHPDLGPMDAFEWLRFVRIYFNNYKLWLEPGGGS